MLIIFDCDGVLVDSESLAAQVFAEELQKFGIEMDAEACERRFRGHTMQYCLTVLERDYSGRLPDDFLITLAEATRSAFEKSLQPVPGVVSVLQWLNTRGWSFCVASNGALTKIQHSLQVTGLLSYLGDRCFSAEQVAAGKPAPDLFLHAARSLGFSADRALVVEDSSTGVTGALAAGMRVCVYGDATVANENAVTRFSRMEQLPGILESLVGF
jgi:HAD superfamily hydrolase (TIGR01509 family)